MAARHPDPTKSRQEILRAAAVLFCRNGMDSTGLRQVADEAEVSNGTLHYHFPSKAELLNALSEEALRPLGRQAREVLRRGGHPRDQLREMTELTYRAFDNDWELYSTVLIHGEQIRLAQPRDFPTWSGALVELVREGQARLLVRDGDAVLLGLMCHGIHIRIPRGRLTGDIRPPLTRYVDAVTDACWRVLRKDSFSDQPTDDL